MIKTCHVCHKPFEVAGGSYRRTVCFDPECIEIHDAEQYQKGLKARARSHAKPQPISGHTNAGTR
jgi:hypothetical protein